MSEETPSKKAPVEVEVDSVDEVFRKAKLDLTDLDIGYHDNINLHFTFPITPGEYLKYAKADFKENTTKGLINALSNAKRSIDCLVESVLRSLGIDPNDIPENALKFCDLVLFEDEKAIRPYSLRLFCALGFAPYFLISEVRLLRNKIEHEFVCPDKASVKTALEVAELLWNNVKAKEIFSTTIDITDCKRHDPEDSGYITGVYFNEDYPSRRDGCCSFVLTLGTKKHGAEIAYRFKGDELVFFFLIRAMFTASHDIETLIDTIKLMFNHIDVKTPREHIKIARTHQ